MKTKSIQFYNGIITGLSTAPSPAQMAVGINNKVQKYEPFIMTDATEITQVGSLTKPTQRLTIGKNIDGIAKTDLQEYATLQEVSDLNTAIGTLNTNINALPSPKYTFWTSPNTTGDSIQIVDPTIETNKTYYGIVTLTGSSTNLFSVSMTQASMVIGQTYYMRIRNTRSGTIKVAIPNTSGHINSTGTGVDLATGKVMTIALIYDGTNYEWQVSEFLTQYA